VGWWAIVVAGGSCAAAREHVGIGWRDERSRTGAGLVDTPASGYPPVHLVRSFSARLEEDSQ
jgi:hypothetical protein